MARGVFQISLDIKVDSNKEFHMERRSFSILEEMMFTKETSRMEKCTDKEHIISQLDRDILERTRTI